MGTFGSTSLANLGGVTNSNGSTLFNGASRYSSDLQQVLTRAVAIASLPIQQLTNEQDALTSQSSALASLGNVFNNLQTALTQLQTASGTGSYTSSVSDGTVAQALVSAGATAGSYTLLVSSLGSYTSTLSADTLPKVTDPTSQNISSGSTFTLTLNGATTAIKPQGTSLDALAEAINSSGAGVQASLVNVGSNTSPDYRLTLQSSKLGPDTIQLSDGTNDLLTTLAPGTVASYQVDGSNAVTSTSRNITLAPGLSVNLLGQSSGSTPTTITVSQSSTGISNALSSFVSAYNSAVDALNAQRGQTAASSSSSSATAGPLQGNSIIFDLQNSLRNISNYRRGSSGVSSLADLGITFDQNGHLQLDSSVISSASATQLTNIASFLGTSTSGGFLETATNTLNSVTDSVSGSIATTSKSLQTQLTHIGDQISTNQDRVNQLQTNLQNQLAKSDALIASLEQTNTLITGLITAEQDAAIAGKN